MMILRFILIPLSILYSLIIFIRNVFYDKGIFKSYSVSIPVISVGNISTGGTGKTPLVIFISKYFLNKGKSVGIISRGYKRKSDDIEIVYDGKNLKSGIDHSGDELMMIYDELVKDYAERFHIIASADRVAAAQIMTLKFFPDVIIMDDGFQHRRLKRDLDIVTVDANDFKNNKFMNSFTIPSGNLREGYSSISRADIIIQNNKSGEIDTLPFLRESGKPVCKISYKTEFFMDFKNSILKENNLNVIAFSGIANDESFIQMILNYGHSIKERINYPDHYDYTQSDINNLTSKYNEGITFITTQKDFVKIKGFREFVERYPVFYLKLNAEFSENKESLLSKLNLLMS